MPATPLTRRQFLRRAAAGGAAALGLHFGGLTPGAEPPAKVPGFTRTRIGGKPRERGRLYGQKFKDAIHAFLDKEIYRAFTQKPSPKDDLLRYAGACGKAVRAYAPVIHDELEGMAEGCGLRLEELVLITLHEELHHKKVLPKTEHCTAVAVGPPDTGDGHTFVGQTWDWMESVFGLSSLLHWERPEGPSLLAYAFPGLWAGAGLNSAGLALCWTSAGNADAPGPRVGVPSYVLLTHLLYQGSLKEVATEARRAAHAGWFTFVLADGKGNLLNVEGSPKELAVEEHQGSLCRVGFGSRAMTRTAEGAKVKYHARCQKMYDLLGASKGKTDRETLQHYFADPKCGICAGKSTLDLMVYDTTAGEAYLSRGPGYAVAWQKFTFADKG